MPRRVPKRLVKIGMTVTCRRTVAAYDPPEIGISAAFTPGTTGRVAHVDCPCVTYAYRVNGGTATFVTVSYNIGGVECRCQLYYNNIKIL
jgi:hypothetical protein